MSWWGKLIGGYMGFALAGPLGALLGGALGHFFDRRNGSVGAAFGQEDTRVQAAFFTATFSVIGHIAKADGRVSSQEIALAEQVIGQMNLQKDQRQAAIHLFQQGKQPDFNLRAVVEQFSQECGRRTNLKKIFLEIQIQAAYADGVKHPAEEKLLIDICNLLGFPNIVLQQLEAMARFHAQHADAASGRSPESSDDELEQAYVLLGVHRNASDTELKRAYRRLMSQHHPDKLVSRGLPEEMVSVATEKTKDIQRAYEAVKRSRGMKK